MASPVSYERLDGIGVITVDNPPVNALSHGVRQGLLDAIQAAQQDDSEAVLIVCALVMDLVARLVERRSLF